MKLISVVLPVSFSEEVVTLYTQLRKEDGPLDGFWEFPGGKIEASELPIDAAHREFVEEVGIDLNKSDLTYFSQHFHSYDDRTLLFYIFYFNSDTYPEIDKRLTGQKIPWESAESIVKNAHVPAANKEFILEFLRFYKKQRGMI